MNLQPGKGYNFVSSNMGVTMDTSNPFPDADGAPKVYQQFECKVESETTAGTTKFYLKTRKGVVNYTWSFFPFRPEDTGGGAGGNFRKFEKQARIIDWAVYQNGKRTAGTATDGEAFEWMANDGRIELPAGTSGASVLVTISKIDWWDAQGWLAAYRTVDAEKPFVAVFPATDANIAGILMQQGESQWHPNTIWKDGTDISFSGPYPHNIGYTYKKIAQLDWNDTTNQWDVTQYEYGPINLPIDHFVQTILAEGIAPTPTPYEDALANEFDSISNYSWFEAMWAYPGYTMNPSNWWYDLVDV